MSDDADRCGAPTSKGGACQNPAESCPWHNTDDPPDTGRDFTIDESDHDDILEAARLGTSKAGCARAAGVDERNLRRYLDANDEFRREFAQARAKGEQRLLDGALFHDENADRHMNGQHARFILSTSFDYIKTERTELTGEDGGAIEVDSDVVTVTDTADE